MTYAEELAQEYNLRAYSDLILCCTGIPFSLVENAKTKNHPYGDAALAWKRLKEKFEEETAASKFELKKQFVMCKPLTGQDPDAWMMDLEHLRNRLSAMGTRMKDDDIIAHIIANLPEEYNELVTSLETNLESLSVKRLKERIRSFYMRRIYSKVEKKNDFIVFLVHKETEKGTRHRYQFKGRCNKCGTYGHKAKYCNNDLNGKTNEKNKLSCQFCKKPGHVKRDCYKFKAAYNRGYPKISAHTRREIALLTTDSSHSAEMERWYADSGTSSRMTSNGECLYNTKRIKENVKIGNGNMLTCETKGGLVLNVKGKITVHLRDVLLVPGLRNNFTSLSKITKSPNIEIRLSKEHIIIKERDGDPLQLFVLKVGETLYCLECTRKGNISTNLMATNENQKETIDINILHNRIGYPSEENTRKAARQNDILLKGGRNFCEGCAYGKARQKNVNKTTETRSVIPFERLFIDNATY